MTTIHVSVPGGRFACDFYNPESEGKAPLVVVIHGFLGDRRKMKMWGIELARHGFVVVVPTLPYWSNHVKNAAVVKDLIEWCVNPPSEGCTALANADCEHVGVVGFSMGGLVTFLAALENPRVKIWVGVDPVDRYGIGLSRAEELRCPALLVKAEPSKWNDFGNFTFIEKKMTCKKASLLVKDGIHSDPAFPIGWFGAWLVGKPSETRWQLFVRYAVAGLQAVLHSDAAAVAVLQSAVYDPLMRVDTAYSSLD